MNFDGKCLIESNGEKIERYYKIYPTEISVSESLCCIILTTNVRLYFNTSCDAEKYAYTHSIDIDIIRWVSNVKLAAIDINTRKYMEITTEILCYYEKKYWF